jgi:hypothetical protein
MKIQGVGPAARKPNLFLIKKLYITAAVSLLDADFDTKL